jgi:hypothetical protein
MARSPRPTHSSLRLSPRPLRLLRSLRLSLRSLRLSLRSLRHSTRLSSRRSPLRPCPPWCGADGGAGLSP